MERLSWRAGVPPTGMRKHGRVGGQASGGEHDRPEDLHLPELAVIQPEQGVPAAGAAAAMGEDV